MTDTEVDLVYRFESAKRRLVGINAKAAGGAEREYSQAWDRMAQKGIGNRRRLRAKYRA